MRAKSTILSCFVLLVFFSCSTIKYKDMASSNPGKLISLRDSLDRELSPGLIDAFMVAYSKVGIEAYNSGNYEKSANLIGYWQFNEGTGSTLTDKTSNSNSGTLTNMNSDDWVGSRFSFAEYEYDYFSHQ